MLLEIEASGRGFSHRSVRFPERMARQATRDWIRIVDVIWRASSRRDRSEWQAKSTSAAQRRLNAWDTMPDYRDAARGVPQSITKARQQDRATVQKGDERGVGR